MPFPVKFPARVAAFAPVLRPSMRSLPLERDAPTGQSRSMSKVTYFVALPIVATDGGEFAALEGVESSTANSAKRRAMGLADQRGGAVAFSRTGDPSRSAISPTP